MIRQIAHINFFTNNLPRMIDFYVNKLGFPVKFALKDKENKAFGYYFDCGHSTFIEVFDQEGAINQWGGEMMELKRDIRFRHVCFEVTDLKNYCKTLEAKDVEVSDITTGMDNSRQAWIKDPDGNSIELMEYCATSLQLTGET
jgi:catechol 2,3-dioxygenase-like lactoylglutathione lyase family enzyme